MWDEQKHSRFQQLQQHQGRSALTEAEQTELALLAQELEAAEAIYLAPATQRLRHEHTALEAKNRRLEALALRKEAFVLRLRKFLTEAQAERRAIDDELAAALAGSPSSQTAE